MIIALLCSGAGLDQRELLDGTAWELALWNATAEQLAAIRQVPSGKHA